VARLKVDQVSLKLVNQGIQQFDISKSSDQNTLGKAEQVEDYKKDLKLKDEEKRELILEKVLWKLFNAGLTKVATIALEMEQEKERAMN